MTGSRIRPAALRKNGPTWVFVAACRSGGKYTPGAAPSGSSVLNAAVLMMLFAGGIAAFMVGASYIIGPRRAKKVKAAPYECGMTTSGPTRRRMTIRYYIVAMLFLVFDL